ncbi:MAG: hypothetical protein Q9160_003293 [Pyrenula sp. 1 TL-2023]
MSDTDKGVPAIVTAVTFTNVATFLIVLRCISRSFMTRNAGADDALILVSWIFSVAFTITVCFQRRYGLGRHYGTLGYEQLVRLEQFFYASLIFYNLSLTFTKISILMLYRRLFVGGYIVYAYRSLLVFVIAYGLWTFWGTVFTCYPIKYFWNNPMTPENCMDRMYLWSANAAINILTDVLIFACPIPVLKTLKLPLRQRLGLIAIFAAGLFVCVMSAVRLRTLHEVTDVKDVSWNNSFAAAWSSVEINTAIGCACLATLRPLVILIPQCLRGNIRKATGSTPRQHGVSSRRRGNYELSTFKSRGADTGAILPPARMPRQRDLGSDSFDEGSCSVETFMYRHNDKVLGHGNRIETMGGNRSLICEGGQADDIAGLIDGRIKVVTQISQDVELKESESEVSNARIKSTEYV